MIILGVDPGFQYSGFAIIKKHENKIMLLEQGFLQMRPKEPLWKRIGEFHDHFDHKVKFWNISDVSLETPFFYKNAQNFLKLGYLRGVLYLIANKNNLKIHEFAPKEIKLALTGYGGAEKEQVARVVAKLFPLLQMPKKYDVTDAIAVSLCGLWNNNLKKF